MPKNILAYGNSCSSSQPDLSFSTSIHHIAPDNECGRVEVSIIGKHTMKNRHEQLRPRNEST